MNFLRHPAVRGLVLVLAVILASGCSTPAYHDFASVAAKPVLATENEKAKAAISSLLDPAGDAPTDLGPLLVRNAGRNGIPAFAAVVLHGNRIVAQGVAGVRRLGAETAVTIDDQFEIASGAKAMSAMLIARLVDDGVLDWDRPLPNYFPGEAIAPEWSKVTLRHLITHTAGLRDPMITFVRSTLVDDGTPMERRLAFARKVLRSPPASSPGAQFAYCNIDYILAGTIAEKVTGVAWEQLMQTRVFVPLGLESAGYGPPGQPGQTLQPWGHGKFRVLQLGVFGNHAFDPGASGADYPAIGSCAGYVHLSIHDWAKLVSLHLRAHPANPKRNVAAAACRDFRTPARNGGDSDVRGRLER